MSFFGLILKENPVSKQKYHLVLNKNPGHLKKDPSWMSVLV